MEEKDLIGRHLLVYTDVGLGAGYRLLKGKRIAGAELVCLRTNGEEEWISIDTVFQGIGEKDIRLLNKEAGEAIESTISTAILDEFDAILDTAREEPRRGVSA